MLFRWCLLVVLVGSWVSFSVVSGQNNSTNSTTTVETVTITTRTTTTLSSSSSASASSSSSSTISTTTTTKSAGIHQQRSGSGGGSGDEVKQRRQPFGVHLGKFTGLNRGLRSGPVVIVDEKTFFIPNFHYNVTDGDSWFWVGRGKQPSASGLAVPDKSGSRLPLGVYTGQNVHLRLPLDLTIRNLDYLSVWSVKSKQSLGHVMIPDDAKGSIPNTGTNGDNRTIIWIQKCCPMNQVLTYSGCVDGEYDFNPIIEVHVHNETHLEEEPIPAETIRFEPFVNQIECPYNKYPLDQSTDNFSLLENGTLMIKTFQKILSQDSYCIESIESDDPQHDGWTTTAIVCFDEEETQPSSTVFAIYAFGILTSAVFLFLTAAVFLLVKEVRDARGKCVIGYSCSMAVAFVCLAVAQLIGADDQACSVLGFIVQFFLVSSFTWLSTISWETYFKIRKYNLDEYSNDRKRLYVYLGVGVCMPLFILIVSLIIDQVPGLPNAFLKPQFGKNSCWFDHKQNTTLYFYVPIAISIVFNIILAALMKFRLMWLEKNKKDDIAWLAVKRELKPMYRSCCFLLGIMTLCWTVETISFLVRTNDSSFMIAIDIINSLQGLLVFLIFVLHRPVNYKLKRLLRTSKNKCRSEEQPIHLNGFNDRNSFLTNLRRADSTEQVP